MRVAFFYHALVDFFHLGSGSVDPHTFADVDPDSGSLNVLDLIHPDPNPDPKSLNFLVLSIDC